MSVTKKTPVLVEKKVQKAVSSLKDLFESIGILVSDSFSDMADSVVRSTKRKGVKSSTAKAIKKKAIKKPASISGKRGRPSGGGLMHHLVEIVKSSDNPLTESDIAKVLLSDKDKYGWNKNESTLYQTLRKAVKENKLVDSGRDKKTKTYKVAS